MREVTTTNFGRRQFLAGVAAGVGTVAMSSPLRAAANEEVRIAILGAGGRGGELARAVNSVSGAKLVAVADPDEKRAASLAGKFGAKPYTDLRAALDSNDVDAVVITTCNHWHCLAALWAIDAGKDVYVEKPLSHSQWEGRQVVEAAKKSGAIVQLGTQQRSDPIQMEARKFLHDDQGLGEIKYVQANRLGVRGPIGKRETPLEIPKELNYDLWLGPAQDQPIMRNSLHYDWHWDWNTGSGEMGNWGVHILDDIRNVAYQDKVSTPSKMIAAGGRMGWNDAGETPNVHFALFETEMFPTVIALSNMSIKPGERGSWKIPGGKPMTGPGSGYVVVCEGGYYLGQRGSGKAVDMDGKTIRSFKASVDIVPAHVSNFVEAVKSRKAESLAAPIENGHHSTGWCNLANVAMRCASNYSDQQVRAASELPAWSAVLDDMHESLKRYGVDMSELKSGPMLTHDPKTERFVGDHADVANPFLRREYRPGYEVKPIA